METSESKFQLSRAFSITDEADPELFSKTERIQMRFMM